VKLAKDKSSFLFTVKKELGDGVSVTTARVLDVLLAFNCKDLFLLYLMRAPNMNKPSKSKAKKGTKTISKARSYAQDNREAKKKKSALNSSTKEDRDAFLSIKRDDKDVLYLEVPNPQSASLIEEFNGKARKASAVSRLYVRDSN